MNEQPEESGVTRRTALGGLGVLMALGVIAATPGTARAADVWWYPHTTKYIVRSGFGDRIHPITFKRTFHDGVDIGSPQGTPIYSMRSGTVTFAGVHNGGFGNYVVVKHDDGFETGYGHQSEIVARAGQVVAAGTLLGRVGSTGASTGAHLHLLMHHNGAPYDPAEILDKAPVATGTAQPSTDTSPTPMKKDDSMLVIANADTNQWVAADQGRWDIIPSGQGDLYVALAGRDRIALSDRDFQLARSYFLAGKQTDTKVYANTANGVWYVIGPGVFYAIPSGQQGVFENAFGPRLAIDNATFQSLQAAFQS